MDLRHLVLLVAGLVLVAGCTSPPDVATPHPLTGKGDACLPDICVLAANATRPFDASALPFEHVLTVHGEPESLRVEGDWVTWLHDRSAVASYHLPTRQIFVQRWSTGSPGETAASNGFLLTTTCHGGYCPAEVRAWKAGTGNLTWDQFGVEQGWKAIGAATADGSAAVLFVRDGNESAASLRILDLKRGTSRELAAPDVLPRHIVGDSLYGAVWDAEMWKLGHVNMKGGAVQEFGLPAFGGIDAGDRLYIENLTEGLVHIIQGASISPAYQIPPRLQANGRLDAVGAHGPWLYSYSSWKAPGKGLWAHDISEGRSQNVTLPLEHGSTGNPVYDIAAVARDGPTEALAISWGRFAGGPWCICINDSGPRLLPT